MSTFTQILYQVVWGPKDHLPVLSKSHRPALFRYIAGILRKKKCHVYAINGVEDHFHIVLYLHPSVALSDLVKDVKIASSMWIKQRAIFAKFKSWQTGYSAFTYQYSAKENLITYVKNQEEHHRKYSFKDELKRLLKEHDVEYEPKYLL